MMTRNECAKWLAEHDNFCILSHRRPDGDTLGSAAALCVGLRQLGKTAYVLENQEASAFLSQCQLGLTCQQAEEDATIISVDVAAPSQLPQQVQQLLPRIALTIMPRPLPSRLQSWWILLPQPAARSFMIF